MTKNYDYKVILNLETSAHGQRRYKTDKEIFEETLDLIRYYLKDKKKSKIFKVQRNYSTKKYLQERKQKAKEGFKYKRKLVNMPEGVRNGN